MLLPPPLQPKAAGWGPISGRPRKNAGEQPQPRLALVNQQDGVLAVMDSTFPVSSM
jgi:hypothetical protein